MKIYDLVLPVVIAFAILLITSNKNAQAAVHYLKDGKIVVTIEKHPEAPEDVQERVDDAVKSRRDGT